MKKRNIIIAASLVAMLLTACGNNDAGQPTTHNTFSSTNETTIIEDVTVPPSSDEGNANESEETSLDETDVSTEETSEGESETTEATEESEERTKIKNCITEVINKNEHPIMDEVVDNVILSEFFLIDTTDEKIEEAVVYQCPMSATMSEIIVIKSSDIDYAKEILEKRKEKAITQDAWYPADQENAEASIVGAVGNYAYYIINSNSAVDETVLVELLGQ